MDSTSPIKLDPSIEQSLEQVYTHNDLSRNYKKNVVKSNFSTQNKSKSKKTIDEIRSLFSSSNNSSNKNIKPVFAKSVKANSKPKRKIYPNKSITHGFKPKLMTNKYSTKMYDPAINMQTLQNFFSVKLVKVKKPVADSKLSPSPNSKSEKNMKSSTLKNSSNASKLRFLEELQLVKTNTNRNQKTEDMFMATNYPKKIKFKNLEPIEKVYYTNTSHNDISRTSTDWKRQAGKQNKVKVQIDTMPELAVFNTTKNEQSGSIDPFTRKSSQNPMNEKRKSEVKNLSEIDDNFQPTNLNSNYKLKTIHDARDQKQKKILYKYSKENLIKSINKKSMAKLPNSTNNDYLSKFNPKDTLKTGGRKSVAGVYEKKSKQMFSKYM